jgi:hypothetical protein
MRRVGARAVAAAGASLPIAEKVLPFRSTTHGEPARSDVPTTRESYRADGESSQGDQVRSRADGAETHGRGVGTLGGC